MRLFDLHCDTIEELKRRGEGYLNCTTQFSLGGRERFQKAVQVMAILVPDGTRGQETVWFVLDYHQYMDNQVRGAGNQAELMKKITDLDRILDEGKWAFIRSIESGVALSEGLDNISRFTDLNFKMLGLVWNGVNKLGSGPNNDTELIASGKEAVRRMEQVSMVMDCSYLDDAGLEDLLSIAECPFVASHSNIRTCCSHPRNLTDARFKGIVRRGGLYSLDLFSRFIDDDDNGGKDYLLHHIYHMLELDGEDVITWDGDMDGKITYDPGPNTPCGVGQFADYLVEHGVGEVVAQKIFFNNAYRLFKQQIK